MPRLRSSQRTGRPTPPPSRRAWLWFGAAAAALLLAMVAFVAALPSGVAQAQPPSTLPNGRVLLEGIVRAWHGDTLEGVAIDHGAGLDIGGQLVTLNINDQRAHELAGKRVRIGGVVANGQLTPDAGGTTVVGAEVAAATSRSVGVILMHFQDKSFAGAPAIDTVRNFMFNNADSVRTHFEQSSDGLATITGDVLGWYTIPYPAAPDANGDGTPECLYSTWSNAGRVAAQNAGVNLANYQYFVYVFPSAPGCGWAGLGQLPGSSSWSNGYINHEVFVHELGHNWGVHHASSMTCTADTDGDPATAKVRVPISAVAGDCTLSEYGDPFGIMGSWNRKLHNNWHRAQLGWLPDQQSITADGRYQLTTVNGVAGGPPRLLSIARGDGSFLVLELRQPEAPFDAFSSGANPANGVSVRITPALSTRSQSKLVDTTPATATHGDAALPIGASFTDPLSGYTITTVSVVGGVAEVDASRAADLTPPSTPGNLNATPQSWSSIQLTWNASTDNRGVAGYRIKRDGVQIATTAALSYTDGGRTASTTYAYEVSAYDAAGNSSTPATDSATTPANVTLKMRVSDVQVTVATGKNKRDQATAVVTLVNEGGAPVGSATVTGNFDKGGTVFSTKSGVTGANGKVSLKSDQTSAAASGTVYKFCVTGATLSGYTLDMTSALCGQVPKP